MPKRSRLAEENVRSGFQMVKRWPIIRKPDFLSGFRMVMAAILFLPFESQTQKVSEKWPFEYQTVWYSVVHCRFLYYAESLLLPINWCWSDKYWNPEYFYVAGYLNNKEHKKIKVNYLKLQQGHTKGERGAHGHLPHAQKYGGRKFCNLKHVLVPPICWCVTPLNSLKPVSPWAHENRIVNR
jgi:hypothetical protein